MLGVKTIRSARSVGFAIALLILLVAGCWPSGSAQAATITVNTLADSVNVSGQCSLRDAIQHANTNSKFYASSACPAGSGHDTITFSVSGTINLGEALNVNSPITVQGPIILSGSEATRLFNVSSNGNLTLVNLTVRDGRSGTAGAIDANNGTLNLAGVSFVNNAAEGSDGGAIRAGRSLNILGSNFSGNQATQRGGAILFTGGASDTLLISATSFSGNLAGQIGGAIAAPTTANVLIFDSVFTGNIAEGTQASHGGGAMHVSNGNDDNEFMIERVAFSGNLTFFGSGGALYLNDDVPTTIRDSSFNGNLSGGPSYAGRGGAIFTQNGNLDIRRTTLNGNLTATTGQGGAFFQAGSGALTLITNSTLFANAAPGGQGGALRVAAGQMRLRNVTLAANEASAGSALYNNGTVQTWNSIFSGPGPTCAATAPQDNGNNLQYPDTSCGGGIASGDPRLESPAFNGGPLTSLLTIGLRADSPAIDAGNNSVCAQPPVANEDQRGLPRPVDGNGDLNAVCDIGAFEAAYRYAGYGSVPIQPGPIMVGTTMTGVATNGSFTIYETGNIDLVVSQPVIAGQHSGSFNLNSSFPLTIPNGGAAAEVQIQCLSNTTGTRTATLSLLTNDPDRPEVVYDLLCQVEAAPAAGFSSQPIAPGPLDFGTVYLGQNGVIDLSFLNSGDADLMLGPIYINGANSGDFSIDFIPPTVPAGHSPIDGQIHCNPSTIGLRSAQLNILTNDPNQPEVSFNLVCHGEVPPLQPLSTPGQSFIHNPAQQLYLDGARRVAISPDGRHVYVTAYNSAAVGRFSRDLESGYLTAGPALISTTLNGVYGIAISPDGEQVYVTAIGGGGTPPNFQVLGRNNNSGNLSGGLAIFRNGIELTDFSGPSGIAVSPNGRHIYVGAGNPGSVFLFRRHASGAVSYVSKITSTQNLEGVQQLTISSDGAYLYATSYSSGSDGRIVVYRRDPLTGELSFLQRLSHDTLQVWPGCQGRVVRGMAGAVGLTLTPAEDYLYVASWSSNAIARFKRNTDGSLCYLGRTTHEVGGVEGLQGAWDVTVTPDGRYLYASAVISDAVTAFERNPATGALTQRQTVVRGGGGLPALDGAQGLALSPDGRSLHVAARVDDALVTLPSANPQPGLSSLIPASATAGGSSISLAVRGSAFAPGAIVQINGTDRPTQFLTANELRVGLTATYLVSAGTLDIDVSNPAPGGGSSANTLTFTISTPGHHPVPTIDFLDPQGKVGGDSGFNLIIKGVSFVNGAQVQWNGSNRSTSFINSGELRAAIPSADLLAPGTAVVTVVNPGPGGGTSNAVAFQVSAPGENPTPSIRGLNPASIITHGVLGSPIQVTIQGQNFLPDSQAHFNGSNRQTVYSSATELRVTLTAMDVGQPGFGTLTVSNPAPGGGTSNAFTLSITREDQLFRDRFQ
jgi:CSLREA domain-containing protein